MTFLGKRQHPDQPSPRPRRPRLGLFGVAVALLVGLVAGAAPASASASAPTVALDTAGPSSPAAKPAARDADPEGQPAGRIIPGPPTPEPGPDSSSSTAPPPASAAAPGTGDRAPTLPPAATPQPGGDVTAAEQRPTPPSSDPAVSADPDDRGPTVPGTTPLPAPGAQEAPGQTCFVIVDKVEPGQDESDIRGSGCRPAGITTPPAVPGDPASAGPSRFGRGAPSAADADSAIPIMELYANTNYGGRSFIVYGYDGPCDGGAGYVINDATNPNSTVGGISSFRAYNNCANEKIYNQTNLRGTPALFYGANVPSLPAAYDNRVYSVRERALCTTYSQTNRSACGAIREKYEDLGGVSGPLGAPTSNELTNPDNVGKRNTFQNRTASIYWSPDSGAYEIEGAIYQKWGQLGYERGTLGYPISSEHEAPGGRANTFANGDIIWTAANNTAAATTGPNPMKDCLALMRKNPAPRWSCSGSGLTATSIGPDGKEQTTFTPTNPLGPSTPYAPGSRTERFGPAGSGSLIGPNVEQGPDAQASPRANALPSAAPGEEGFDCTNALCPRRINDTTYVVGANANYGTTNEIYGNLKYSYTTEAAQGRVAFMRAVVLVTQGPPIDPTFELACFQEYRDFKDSDCGGDYFSPNAPMNKYDTGRVAVSGPLENSGDYYTQEFGRYIAQDRPNPDSPTGEFYQRPEIYSPIFNCPPSPGQCGFPPRPERYPEGVVQPTS